MKVEHTKAMEQPDAHILRNEPFLCVHRIKSHR